MFRKANTILRESVILAIDVKSYGAALVKGKWFVFEQIAAQKDQMAMQPDSAALLLGLLNQTKHVFFLPNVGKRTH